MAPFDDLPLTHVDPVTPAHSVLRARRVRAIALPPDVVPPLGNQLAEWQRRRREGEEAREASLQVQDAEVEAPALAVDPPETYSEHGELQHAHGAATEESPHLDLKV